jgi:hypothetical protein
VAIARFEGLRELKLVRGVERPKLRHWNGKRNCDTRKGRRLPPAEAVFDWHRNDTTHCIGHGVVTTKQLYLNAAEFCPKFTCIGTLLGDACQICSAHNVNYMSRTSET